MFNQKCKWQYAQQFWVDANPFRLDYCLGCKQSFRGRDIKDSMWKQRRNAMAGRVQQKMRGVWLSVVVVGVERPPTARHRGRHWANTCKYSAPIH